MTVTDTTLSLAEQDSLNYLSESFSHIGVGVDNSVYDDGMSDLVSKVLTVVLADKNLNLGEKYVVFAIRIPATQAQSSTVVEVGVFDALSGGNLGSRDVCVGTVKSVEEQWIDVLVQVSAENN